MKEETSVVIGKSSSFNVIYFYLNFTMTKTQNVIKRSIKAQDDVALSLVVIGIVAKIVVLNDVPVA